MSRDIYEELATKAGSRRRVILRHQLPRTILSRALAYGLLERRRISQRSFVYVLTSRGAAAIGVPALRRPLGPTALWGQLAPVLLETFNDLDGARHIDERDEEWEELGFTPAPTDQLYIDKDRHVWRVYAPSEYADISSIRNEVKHHLKRRRGFGLWLCLPRVRIKSARKMLSQPIRRRNREWGRPLIERIPIQFWPIPGLSQIEQALKELGS